MKVGRLCKRASQRAAKQSIPGAKKTSKWLTGSESAPQGGGVVAFFPISACNILADPSWASSADRRINGAFGNSLHSKDEQQQLQDLRRRPEPRRSVRPNNEIECEECSRSSWTNFKGLEQQVLTSRGVFRRRAYCNDSSRSLWGSLPRRNYFHADGGAAAGLESSASASSAPADIVNLRPSSGEDSKRTTVVIVEDRVAANPFEETIEVTVEDRAAANQFEETIEVTVEDREAANQFEEIIEASKEGVVHSHPTTTRTIQSALGPFQARDLPQIENPTAKVVQRVCSILDIQEWGPGTLENLEDANLVITPFLIQQIVHRMSSKNVDLTWNFFKWAREKAGGKVSMRAHIAMLDALGSSKDFGTLKEAFALVFEDGYRRSAWPYNSALKWCSAAENVEAALYFWSKMKENNCKATVVTYTRLIDLVARQGFHQESLEIFRQMLQANCPPNISTYNVLIRAFGVAGQPEVAESLFDRLSELGCKPNYTTYNTLISLHVGAGKPERALKYFNMMKAAGMDIADDVCRTLELPLLRVQDVPEQIESHDKIDSFGTENRPATVLSYPDFLSSLPGRIISPNALVRLLEKGEPLSVEAKLDKIKPLIHARFVVQVLQRIKNPNTAMIFFDWAKDQPYFKHNEHSYCMMINILGRSRSNEALDRIMNEMQEQGITMSTPIITALITCYGRANDMEGALKVFHQMKEWGFKPDIVTYTSLIHLLAKHGSYEPAVNMFEEMKQAGIAPNMHTYSVMIYNLVKAGKVTEAVALLKAMPGLGCQPSPITFATIIDHCAKEGQVEMAKNLLGQMEEQGIKPLKVTIIVLEAAFRKAGMTEDADKVIEKSRSRRFWDENFKSSTEKVAQELLFKDFAKGESSRHSVKC